MLDPKLPPGDPMLERKILGTIIANSEAYLKSREVINEECFIDDRNKELYVLMGKMTDRDIRITLTSIAHHGTRVTGLKTLGGAAYITETGGLGDLDANLVTNCRILYEIYMRRILMSIGSKAYYDCATTDPFELRDNLEKEIVDLVPIGKDTISTQSGVIKLGEYFERVRVNGIGGIKTGVAEFDTHVGGLNGSDLIVIGSFSSNGKTSVATNIVFNAAEMGIRSKYYTFEQPMQQIVLRQVAMLCGIPSKRIIMDRMFDSVKVKEAIKRISGHETLYAERCNHITDLVVDIRHSVKRLGVKFVVIDYLGLLLSDHREIRISMGYIANRLKTLANELDIPIILVSQLSRPPAGSSVKTPKLHMLKESGEIENAADVVWMPFIPANEPADMKEIAFGDINMPTICCGVKMVVHSIPKGRNYGTTRWYGYIDDTTKLLTKDQVETEIQDSYVDPF